MRLPCGFDPEGLEAPLAVLDRLPRTLWLQGIVNSVGALHARLAGVEQLGDALTAGALPAPAEWRWPVAPVLAAFAPRIAELELPRYCAGAPEVTEQVVKSLLWHTDRIIDYRNEADEAGAVARAVDSFCEDWRERTGEMDQLVWVLGELGELVKNDRWDLLRGLLRSAGWQQMLRVRKLLERLPEVSRLIRRLGRAVQTDEADDSCQVPVQLMEETTCVVRQRREVRVPDMPAETRGVRRSGSIARMLPAEALLLAHPKLKLVWFARHAERTLLTYEDSDTLSETVLTQARAWQPTQTRRPDRRLEMGPLIVCVDTSGSMAGPSEDVAKAVVLEAMRCARAQKRACYAYAFGGPGEIIGRELGVDIDGLDAALGFLTQSFHGGTDIGEPLEQALARIEEQTWRFADLLIASDGEFGAVPALVMRLNEAKRRLGLRVQGVLVGDRETLGMRELCDDIHWVRDWRRFGLGGDSPVHSKDLTAEYFPAAVR